MMTVAVAGAVAVAIAVSASVYVPGLLLFVVVLMLDTYLVCAFLER